VIRLANRIPGMVRNKMCGAVTNADKTTMGIITNLDFLVFFQSKQKITIIEKNTTEKI
jgi:hypothetical protein